MAGHQPYFHCIYFIFAADKHAEESDVKEKQKLVKRLIRQEISENLAKAAVQAVDMLDDDECFLWVLENANDASIVAKHHKAYDDAIGKLKHPYLYLQPDSKISNQIQSCNALKFFCFCFFYLLLLAWQTVSSEKNKQPKT